MKGFRSIRHIGLVGALGLSLLVTGCRVTQDDVHRWEGTQQGPTKLAAVLLHDKYELPLRIEAALSLVRMKPRSGQRVGIGQMVATLEKVGPQAQQAIVSGLVPAIIAELEKAPPAPAAAGQPAAIDPSFPYKDAAFALLTAKEPPLITDGAVKEQLESALRSWALTNFDDRLTNRSQMHGMEELLRLLGSPSVVGLPKLMTRDAPNLDRMVALVSELGDAETKAAASEAVTSIAKYVDSEEWIKAKTPDLKAANKASGLTVTDKQFAGQIAQYQEEELTRDFATMKKIGGRPVVDFLLAFAANGKEEPKRRQAALSALEGNLDRNNPSDIQKVLAIASASDTPDVVLDQAFRRIGELPRDQVASKLYSFFDSDKWKVRRAAAGTLLKMSKVEHIDEFMGKLGGVKKGFVMDEAIGYGAFLGDLKGGPVRGALTKYLTRGSIPERTSALGYYFNFGTPADLPAVDGLKSDSTKIPECDTGPECKWACEVPKEGAKDPNERVSKDIGTIGEFVTYCIEPAMKTRKPETKEAQK